MTLQESKDMLKAKLTCLELDSDPEGCNCDCEGCEYSYTQGTFDEQKEALKIAIEALKKQVSQKPIYHDNCGNKTVSARCPRCHEVFDENGLQKYCGFCGQKVKMVGIWKD